MLNAGAVGAAAIGATLLLRDGGALEVLWPYGADGLALFRPLEDEAGGLGCFMPKPNVKLKTNELLQRNWRSNNKF